MPSPAPTPRFGERRRRGAPAGPRRPAPSGAPAQCGLRGNKCGHYRTQGSNGLIDLAENRVKPSQALAKTFIGVVAFIGLLAVLGPLANTSDLWSTRFACYLVLALLSSSLKVSLPGVTGTLSVSFLFILASMAELGVLETIVIGTGATLVQIYWNAKRRPPLHQVLFNLASIAIAIRFAEAAMHWAEARGVSLPFQLLCATLGYFIANTIPIAA